MNPQKKQIIIVGALGALLVVVLGYQLTRKPPPPPDTKGAAGVETAGANTEGGAAASKPAPSKSPKAGKAGAKNDKTQLKKANIDVDELLRKVEQETFDYGAERMPRDVMRPLFAPLLPPGGRKVVSPGANPVAMGPSGSVIEAMNKDVTGIVWDNRYPLAVIRDSSTGTEEVVSEGYEYPSGVVVESIEPDHVKLRVNDTVIERPLKEL